MSIAGVGTQGAAQALVGTPAVVPDPGPGAVVPAARPGERVRLVLRRRAVGPSADASTSTGGVLGSGRQLVTADGCDVLMGTIPLSPAARLAFLTWLPPSPHELHALDAAPFHDEPSVAVGLLLRPPTIWSATDAIAVRRRLVGASEDAVSIADVERVGVGLVGSRQLLRLRAAVARLRAQLPFAEFVHASATVRAGCAALEEDRGKATAVAVTQLARYVTSAVLRE